MSSNLPYLLGIGMEVAACKPKQTVELFDL